MSTTTNFKRIALVAVAALGLGLLSSASSQATIEGTPTVTVENGTAGISGQKSDSTTAATIAVRYFAADDADTASITVTLGTRPTASSVGLGGGNLLVTALDTATSTGLTLTSPLTTVDSRVATAPVPTITAGIDSFAAAKFAVFLDSSVAGRTAGTYIMNYVVRFFEAGVVNGDKTQTGTFNIVVSDGTAAAAGTAASAATSTAVMVKEASSAGEGTDETDLRAVMTVADKAMAKITVTAKTATGLTTRESVTVSTTKGFVGTTASMATASPVKTLTLVGGANGVNDVYLFTDGTSGTATISIKTTSVTFSNKSAVFYGTTVTKITAVQLGKTLGGSAAAAIAAVASDADGNQITSDTAVYAYSSNLTAVNTGATTGTACTYSPTAKVHMCSLAGSNDGTADITLRNKNTVALSTVASNVIPVVVNTKSPVALKLAFDKATYAPGEAAYVRLWAVDASGAPVAPGLRSSLLSAAGITSSASFGNGTIADSLTVDSVSPTLGFTTAASNGFASVEPIYLAKVFMPASGGTVTLSATGGSLLPAAGQVAVTATATVTDSGAAALAAVTALATTVASLRTLIVTLTNLVLKIQKKVRA